LIVRQEVLVQGAIKAQKTVARPGAARPNTHDDEQPCRQKHMLQSREPGNCLPPGYLENNKDLNKKFWGELMAYFLYDTDRIEKEKNWGDIHTR
jgi:hypothetical protein